MLVVLVARKHVDRRMLAAGIVAAAIIALPFVYGVIRTRGEGWRASLSFVSGAAKIDSQALRL